MKYRILGRTGLEVSVVGLGTYQFGGRWAKSFTQAEVDEIIEAARETGINLIDTAECYGDHVSERLIGSAIKRDRDSWILATKFGHRRISFEVQEHHWKPEEVRLQLEESLKSLKTDYVDLYQFHSGSNEVFDNDELWTMLDKQVRAGKVRFLGISVSTRSPEWRIHQAENALKVGASVIQVVYNRLERKAEGEVFPICKRDNLGVLARVPLASGLLSGKYGPGYRFPENDVRSRNIKVEDLDRMLAEVEEIKEKELPEGVSMPVWALSWILKNPIVSATIPGAKNAQYVRENARVADIL